MNPYVTGTVIKGLRERKGLTQAQLAARLQVSDKAVSKWETAKGYPDITLIEPLAQALDMEFLDSDREIERLHGGTLAQLIAVHGQDGFRRLEEEVNAGLRVEHTVIAPGGSVIYGPEAMAHLRAISRVIYLRLSYENVAARLGDLTARGVTFAPGQTLRDLYRERCPLYERYAHGTVDCDGLTPEETVQAVRRLL